MLLLDITIVNVALPDIQRALHSSFADLQWVVDAYALTLASFLLTAGSLADMYGRRVLWLIGLVVFTGASALCGFATSTLMLQLSRGLQGAGGAIMFAVSLASAWTHLIPGMIVAGAGAGMVNPPLAGRAGTQAGSGRVAATTTVVHGRDADRGSAVAGTITAAGGKARFVTADLTDPAQLDHLAEQAGPVAQGQLHHRRGHCRRRRPHRDLIPAARQERRRIPGRHFLRYVSRHVVHARPCRTLTQPTPREGNTNREQFAVRSHL